MKRLRRVTEAEVIAEFLKNEFYQEEFHQDREQFEHVVLDADLSDQMGNALRRALLFRRRAWLSEDGVDYLFVGCHWWNS